MHDNAFDELQAHTDIIHKEYEVSGTLHFQQLKGGICNSPVYAYQLHDGCEKPVGVFKREIENHNFANARFAMIDDITKNGFKQHPKLYKNRQGKYLTQIGDSYYSLIEYIKPDDGNRESTVSMTEMIELTDTFHQHAQALGARCDVEFNRYQLHMSRQNIVNQLETIGIDTTFFTSKSWQRFLSIYQFFATQQATEIFNSLPHQVIHGDNHQHNLIFRNGIAYFIDLDARRYDLRLYDFTSMIRHSSDEILEDFFHLAKTDRLIDFIDRHYGIHALPLTQQEKQHFYLILAFSYVEFVSWALNEIKLCIAQKKSGHAAHLFGLVQSRISYVLRLQDEKLLEI